MNIFCETIIQNLENSIHDKKFIIETIKNITLSLFYAIKNRCVEDEIVLIELLKKHLYLYNVVYRRNFNANKLITTPIPLSSVPLEGRDGVFVFDECTNRELYDALMRL
jgi:hypothetical protein